MEPTEALQALIDAHSIRVEPVPAPHNHVEKAGYGYQFNFSVKVSGGGLDTPSHVDPLSFVAPYSVGEGIACPGSFPRTEHEARIVRETGKAYRPPAVDVVGCLLKDASALDCETFEDWAGESDFDPDSRKAEAIYRTCMENGRKIRHMFGNDFDKARELAHEL